MDIEKQFNLIAEEYDDNRRKFIPCFDDFYKSTTELIASNIDEPKRIIDLGAGTGLLTYFWYQQFPKSEYVLVDIADEMLNIARRRFDGVGTISYRVENYIHKLPDPAFDAVLSALSIHHLEDGDKIKLFKKIYNELPEGGIFINYDQFCAENARMDRWFNSYWEDHLVNIGLTDDDIELWRERRKLDRECSVEQETDMLRKSGFKDVQCMYSYQKFSVIAAVR